MKPLIYITRDIERALGIIPNNNTENPYKIVTNTTPYAEIFARKYPESVHLIKSEKVLDTYDLMIHPEVDRIVSEYGGDILVFKNTSRIQTHTQNKGWNLINPDANLSDMIESKISQVEWLGPLIKYLPEHDIKLTKNINKNPKEFPFILQWDHGHTGKGTLLIETQEQLLGIQKQFPDRPARISKYVQGTVYTQNIVVGNPIISGSISEQLTGLEPLTDSLCATVGNDWQSPTSLPRLVNDAISEIGTAIAKHLMSHDWKGLFGIDIIVDTNNKVYLLEINARQPASASLESQLQRDSGVHKTIFDYHIASLRNYEWPSESIMLINHGGQIIQRVTENIKSVSQKCMDSLENKGYTTIYYPMNTIPGSDILRIQTTKSVRDMFTNYKEILLSLSKSDPR